MTHHGSEATMTRIDIQVELAARDARAFSLQASRLNRLAIERRRAQHERLFSPTATRYRNGARVARRGR
jgi:hypothetical protein